MELSFSKYTDLLQKGMATIQFRQSVISNNIANVTTPQFKRSEVNFETHLKEALDSESAKPSFIAKKTHPGHIDFNRPLDYQAVTPRRHLDWQTQSKNNGNNVDIEYEYTDYVKSVQLYNLMAQSLRDSFRRLNIVLQ